MVALIIVLGFLAYIILDTISTFFFTYKVYLVNNDKYKLAAIMSGLGLFISFTLYAFIPFLTVVINWYWAIVLIAALAIGNFFANAVLSRIDIFHSKKDKSKKGEE